MLPDRVSNREPLTYESGALRIALHGPAVSMYKFIHYDGLYHCERLVIIIFRVHV